MNKTLSLIDQKTFLEKFNIKPDVFDETGLSWENLERIYEHYVRIRPSFQATLNYVREQLGSIEKVHSIKARLKDPEHLIEKIIRKSTGQPGQAHITLENYQDRISDLIGIRALHLFKTDWAYIHDSIVSHWEMTESPQAKIRQGDNSAFIQQFKDRNCEIKETSAGYRSVHYVIESRPSKGRVLVEIQVRTLFEEGWSEVDHQVRYPYGSSPLVGSFLDVFNRLAGGADEMATFIMNLQREFDNLKEQQLKLSNDYATLREERTLASAQMKKLINDLKIESEEKAKLELELEKLKPRNTGLELDSFKIDPNIAAAIKALGMLTFQYTKQPTAPPVKLPPVLVKKPK